MNKDTHLIYEAYALKGVAFGMNLDDIARKHGAELSSLTKEFEKGKRIEMEHTKDEKTAEKIAKDHLFEDPCYYSKLTKIESEDQEVRSFSPDESCENGYDAKEYADEMERKGIGQKISGEEDSEGMPGDVFNKLKAHIPKSPITIKKPSKEHPYTHRYIHDLAKQDPREGQKEEENAEDRNTSMWVDTFYRTFGPGNKEGMEKNNIDPYEFFVDYYEWMRSSPENVTRFANIYNTKYPNNQVDIEKLLSLFNAIKDRPMVGYKSPAK